MIKIKLIIPILLLSFVHLSCAQATKYHEDKFNKVDAFLTALTNQAGFSGSVLIDYKGGIFKKGYGYSDREHEIQASANTIYDIGSVTKQFTGAAILKLEMQNKLKVSDPISKYFDNVPNDKASITIHYLLTHSSGLPGAIGNDEEQINREDYIQKALEQPLLFNPGTKYSYSNVGYSILAAIIEKVSNMSYESFLRNNLFLPSDMNDTGYILPNWDKNRIANGYKDNMNRKKPTDKNWNINGPSWHLIGNGGILSTVEDMYKWHQALLGEKILSKSAKEKFYARNIEEGSGSGTYYGYGWAKFPTSRGTWLTTHNGGNGIFFCDYFRYLEGEDLTVVFMTNSNGPMFNTLGYQIAKTMLDNDYKPTFTLNQPTAQMYNLENHPNSKLLKDLIEKIAFGNSEDISAFIKTNFEERFFNMASVDQHLSVLARIGQKIKGKEIDNILVVNDENIISFKNESFKLTVNLGNDKITGMGIED